MHTHPITILSSALELGWFELSFGTEGRRLELLYIERFERGRYIRARTRSAIRARAAGGTRLRLQLTRRGLAALHHWLNRR